MKHSSVQCVLTSLVVGLAAAWVAPCARAQIIYTQAYDGSSPGWNSQIYTDSYANYSSKAFDDVIVPVGQTWNITQVIAFGQEQGTPSQNVSVNLQFASSPNYTSAATVYTGSENVSGNLVFTSPITLTAGTYWITAYVTRPETPTGGQWYWDETNINNPIGSEFYFQNPGGEYGYGTDPVAGSAYNAYTADLAFQISGQVVVSTPEPSSILLALLGIGGWTGHRLYRRRHPKTLPLEDEGMVVV